MKIIIGVNFGSSITQIYYGNLFMDIPDTTPLIPGGLPSGYGIAKSGELIVGMGICGCSLQSLYKLHSFYPNIKFKPDYNNRSSMVCYLEAWRRYIESTEEFKDVNEAYWVIGYPAADESYSETTQKWFENIFKDAGFRNVYIVPKYQALLTYDHCDSESNYLIIHQNNYFLEATYYDGVKATSYGEDLGEDLIERMMIHTILESDEEDIRAGKVMLNLPETIKGAMDLINSEGPNGYPYMYLLKQARVLKHDFLYKMIFGLNTKRDTLRTTYFNADDDCLILFTNHQMMENIFEKYPIKTILKSELREHYPHAKVHCDREAIAAIGKGMAYWGPDKVTSIEFEKALLPLHIYSVHLYFRQEMQLQLLKLLCLETVQNWSVQL